MCVLVAKPTRCRQPLDSVLLRTGIGVLHCSTSAQGFVFAHIMQGWEFRPPVLQVARIQDKLPRPWVGGLHGLLTAG